MFNPIMPKNVYDNTPSGSYNANLYYNNNVLQSSYYPYQFDGWLKNQKYGVIHDGNIIYPRKSALKLYTNNNGNTHNNISFVVDAFQDMKIFMKELVRRNIIGDISSIFVSLNVEESTVDVEKLYLDHLNNLADTFSKVYTTEYYANITTIQQFTQYFLDYLKIVTEVTPINRQTFIGSNLVPDSINGLYISFDRTANPRNIVTKANTFIGHPTFNTYIEVASRFGFLVDRNFPWRLVADLNSPIMKSYYKPYGFKDMNDIFRRMYWKSYSIDIQSLRNIFIGMWNGYVKTRTSAVRVTDAKSCKNLFSEVTQLSFMTSDLFDYYFNINWQIRLYLFTRILEERIEITQNKFEEIHEQACKENKFTDIVSATAYINQEIKFLSSIKKDVIYDSLTTGDAIVKLFKTGAIKIPNSKIIF